MGGAAAPLEIGDWRWEFGGRRGVGSWEFGDWGKKRSLKIGDGRLGEEEEFEDWRLEFGRRKGV
jgi:hypothetical protein